MRATRVELVHGRAQVPLVIRARFEKTFFGLGAFAALVLLLGGGYLMAEALLDPVGASDAAVLVAGFALALSSFLLVYFVWPRGRLELAKQERERLSEQEKWNQPAFARYGDTGHPRIPANSPLREEKHAPGPMCRVNRAQPQRNNSSPEEYDGGARVRQ